MVRAGFFFHVALCKCVFKNLLLIKTYFYSDSLHTKPVSTSEKFGQTLSKNPEVPLDFFFFFSHHHKGVTFGKVSGLKRLEKLTGTVKESSTTVVLQKETTVHYATGHSKSLQWALLWT